MSCTEDCVYPHLRTRESERASAWAHTHMYSAHSHYCLADTVAVIRYFRCINISLLFHRYMYVFRCLAPYLLSSFLFLFQFTLNWFYFICVLAPFNLSNYLAVFSPSCAFILCSLSVCLVFSSRCSFATRDVTCFISLRSIFVFFSRTIYRVACSICKSSCTIINVGTHNCS